MTERVYLNTSQLFELRRQQGEIQRWKCLTCPRKVDWVNTDSKRPSALVKINKKEHVHEHNVAILCVKCAEYYSYEDNLISFCENYDHVREKSPAFKRKCKTHKIYYPLTNLFVRVEFFAKCLANGLSLKENFQFKKSYDTVPPSPANIANISDTHLANYVRDHQEDGSSRKSRGYTFKRSVKVRFLESQNHRCCYCGDRFDVNNPKHPDYATWEHVVERSKGGTNSVTNMVLACSFCNNRRDILRLSAEDYYQWAIKNKNLLIKLKNERRRSKNRCPEDNMMASPLYDYS